MSAHIYWRVRSSKAPGAKKPVNISRLEMHPIVGGINLCVIGAGVVSASSEAKSTKDYTFEAYNAVDNNQYDDWMSEAIVDFQWIEYKFSVAQQVLEIQLTSSFEPKYIKYAPQDFELQWSDDGIEWTTSFTVTGELDWRIGENRVFYSLDLKPTLDLSYTSDTASPLTSHKSLVISKEADSAAPVSIHINRYAPISTAPEKDIAIPITTISAQYIPVGVASESNVPLDVIVGVTVVLIEPTIQPSIALPLTVIKHACPLTECDCGLSIVPVKTKATDEFGYAYQIKPIFTTPVKQFEVVSGAMPVSAGKKLPVLQANELGVANISTWKTTSHIVSADTYSLGQQINADKKNTLVQPSTPSSANPVEISRSKEIVLAAESDSAYVMLTSRFIDILLSSEKDEALPSSINRGINILTAAESVAGNTFDIKRERILGLSPEKDSGLEIRPSRGFDFNQAERLSSAYPMDYALSVRLQIAEEKSLAIAVVAPQKIGIGIASEEDSSIGMFQCPIYEADSAYSIERGFPSIVHTAFEKDEPLSIRPVRSIPVGRAIEGDVTIDVRFTRVTVIYNAIERDSGTEGNWPPFVPVRTVDFSQAEGKSSAQSINEDKSQTLAGASTNVLALRVFPPYSGTLGIAGEDDTNSELSSTKNQGITQVSEKDESTALTAEYALHLGLALENDIARLANHFNTVRLDIINAQSGGLPVDPLRTVAIGQAASKDDGGAWNRDRDISMGIASTGSSATSHYIHVADQFNQAVEGEVARYVTAVKSKALQLASEDDSVYTLAKLLKLRGFNIGSEKDTALAVRTAFANDIGFPTEKDSARSMSALKTAILRYADDGEFAYALDKFLKVQGLNQVVEQDVAHIPVANLTKEIAKAFEYNEALRIDATRVQFLRTVATNEVAHALGQTMKRQLIGLAASSSDAPYLTGEQPWRNKWQASVSIQQDIEFSLPVQQDFEGVVSLQQDAEFIVAIQESKQLVEEI